MFHWSVVWIAAVIGISILGLVVGVLFGGPTTCINQTRHTATSTSSRGTGGGGTSAAASATHGTTTVNHHKSSNKVKSSSNSSCEQKRAFELIERDTYSPFEIKNKTKEQQVSDSQDKRNSTCKPDHHVPVSILK